MSGESKSSESHEIASLEGRDSKSFLAEKYPVEVAELNAAFIPRSASYGSRANLAYIYQQIDSLNKAGLPAFAEQLESRISDLAALTLKEKKLQTQKTQLDEQIRALDQAHFPERNALQEKQTGLIARIAQISTEIERLEAKRMALVTRPMNSTEMALQKKIDKISSAMDQFSEVKSSDTPVEAADVKAEYDRLISSLTAAVDAKIAELSAQVLVAVERAEKFRADANAVIEANTEQKNQIKAEIQQEVSVVEASLNDKKAALKAQEKEIKRLEKELSNAQHDHGKLSFEIQRNRDAQTVCSDQVAVLAEAKEKLESAHSESTIETATSGEDGFGVPVSHAKMGALRSRAIGLFKKGKEVIATGIKGKPLDLDQLVAELAKLRTDAADLEDRSWKSEVHVQKTAAALGVAKKALEATHQEISVGQAKLETIKREGAEKLRSLQAQHAPVRDAKAAELKRLLDEVDLLKAQLAGIEESKEALNKISDLSESTADVFNDEIRLAALKKALNHSEVDSCISLSKSYKAASWPQAKEILPSEVDRRELLNKKTQLELALQQSREAGLDVLMAKKARKTQAVAALEQDKSQVGVELAEFLEVRRAPLLTDQSACVESLDALASQKDACVRRISDLRKQIAGVSAVFSEESVTPSEVNNHLELWKQLFSREIRDFLAKFNQLRNREPFPEGAQILSYAGLSDETRAVADRIEDKAKNARASGRQTPQIEVNFYDIYPILQDMWKDFQEKAGSALKTEAVRMEKCRQEIRESRRRAQEEALRKAAEERTAEEVIRPKAPGGEICAPTLMSALSSQLLSSRQGDGRLASSEPSQSATQKTPGCWAGFKRFLMCLFCCLLCCFKSQNQVSPAPEKVAAQGASVMRRGASAVAPRQESVNTPTTA